MTTASTEPRWSWLWAFGCGWCFGSGLLLAGMTDAAKVVAFLDVAGLWDPSLALVMVGAISVSALAFRFSKSRHSTLLEQPFHWPDRTAIDSKLVVGSSLFGIGWGLLGLCPGPAIVLAGTIQPSVLVFVLFMLLGIKLVDWLTVKFDND